MDEANASFPPERRSLVPSLSSSAPLKKCDKNTKSAHRMRNCRRKDSLADLWPLTSDLAQKGVGVMKSRDSDRRLSRISTLWSLVSLAQHEGGDESRTAQQKLLERYGPAIRVYLLGAVRDAEAAEDLWQEFAYRFLQGDMRGIDPQRG